MTSQSNPPIPQQKKSFRIHYEGFPILLTAFVFFSLLNWIMVSFVGIYWLSLLVGVLSISLFILLVNFFRNPNRHNSLADEEGAITSPCDGKLVVVEEVFESEILRKQCLKVSIFMSILDVHANWVAVRGKVTHVSHQEGNFLMAFLPKSSTENERSAVVLETPEGYTILERQIAGAVARRISTYLKEGQEVTGNSHLGFIKFGSRIDLYLPLGTTINIPLGAKVKGNSTLLGYLPRGEKVDY